MTPLMSIYLDLVRFGAALVVVLSHVWPALVPKHPLPWPGHHAVVVFFVLSGFVIAFVTDGREATLSDYVLRRTARIWSVSLPAIILSVFAAAIIGASAGSDPAAPHMSVSDVLHGAALNAVFAGQLWTVDIDPPLDGAFWSLNYEVWYYAIFGAWVYLRGRARFLGALAFACVAGPKIVLMLPCWLAGVWLYRHRPAMPQRTAILLFCGSIVLYLVFLQIDLPILIRTRMIVAAPELMQLLRGSNTFVGDYVLAAIVVMNFAAVANVRLPRAAPLALRRASSGAASYTFSLYLYHMPLVALAQWWLRLPSTGTALFLVAGIVVLGRVTEHKLPMFRARLALLIVRTTGWNPRKPSPPSTLCAPEVR